MGDRVERSGLQVARVLADFIEQQALPGTGFDPDSFWAGTAEIFARYAPENIMLLARHFGNIYSSKYMKPQPEFDEKAIEKLRNHQFPGN